MARLFRTRSAQHGRLVAGVMTLGVSGAAMIALVTSGGVASAAPVYTAYTVNATGAGLNLNLFGNKLSGGNSTACANYTSSGSPLANLDGNGNPTPCDTSKGGTPYMAYAEGEGTLLTSAGLTGKQTASATGVGQTATPTPSGNNSTADCSPLNSGGFKGASGVGLDLGVSCGIATAAIDAGGNPSAQGTGDVAHLGLDLNGILSAIAGASPQTGTADLCNQDTGANQSVGQLLNTVCQVLNSVAGGGGSSAPAPVGGLFDGINQALQDLNDVAKNDTVPCPLFPAADTPAIACVEVGPAQSTISSASDGTVTAKSIGETLELDVLPGVGCTAGTSLATCALNDVTYVSNEADNPTAAPLVTVKVGPAECTETLDPTTAQWTSSSYSSIVDVDLNIPGDNIPIHIPGSSAPGTSQTILSGTPLQTTIRIANASSTAPIGDSAGCGGDSLTVSTLESGTLPGGSTTPGGGAVTVSLGNTQSGANATGAASQTQATTATTAASSGTSLPAVQTAAASGSPTSVHTGEWWAGSLPLIGVLIALGAGLIAWPRMRLVPVVARLVSRVHR